MTDTDTPDTAAVRVAALRTGTARLRAIADIVEADDGRWKQSEWHALRDVIVRGYEELDAVELQAVATRHTCGSYGCIAGWSVAMLPPKAINNIPSYYGWDGYDYGPTWETAGAYALDLPFDYAEWLFDGQLGRETVYRRTGSEHAYTRSYPHRAQRVAMILRWLADIPTRQRRDADPAALIAASQSILRTGKLPKTDAAR